MPEAEALPSVNTVSMYLRWPRCRCTQNNAMEALLHRAVPGSLFCRGAGSQVRDTLALDVKDLPWLSLATRLSSILLTPRDRSGDTRGQLASFLKGFRLLRVVHSGRHVRLTVVLGHWHIRRS